MIKRVSLFSILLLFNLYSLKAQNSQHYASQEYEYPKEPEVRAKLEEWRDLKFGMLIHWGVYSVPGIIESWSLCDEDWIRRDSTTNYADYKKWYWGLKDQFNPTKFDPDSWAKAAKDAGMKYVIFTTKHHDGFNMFDTKYTDYKITNGPFANNPKSNVAYYVFDAFRKKDFMVGAYYSKPDWHSQYFWWDLHATPNRNVNYNILKNPWRWNQFKQFTFNQINELTSDYGKVDMLWLDGGWVRPRETVNEEVLSWGAPIPDFSQEINMPKIAEMARKNQPGILIVDRTVHGPYENYRTPEQSIPKEMSETPWESCITLGNAWGYVKNDKFKSPSKVIKILIEVVAKGGSLALGVGPTPEGLFLDEQVRILNEIGKWLKINGEAIYGTRTTKHFQEGNMFFTKGKTATYMLMPIEEGGKPNPTIVWSGNLPSKNSKITILSEEKPIKWMKDGNKVIIHLPKEMVEKYKDYPAMVFKFN